MSFHFFPLNYEFLEPRLHILKRSDLENRIGRVNGMHTLLCPERDNVRSAGGLRIQIGEAGRPTATYRCAWEVKGCSPPLELPSMRMGRCLKSDGFGHEPIVCATYQEKTQCPPIWGLFMCCYDARLMIVWSFYAVVMGFLDMVVIMWVFSFGDHVWAVEANEAVPKFSARQWKILPRLRMHSWNRTSFSFHIRLV